MQSKETFLRVAQVLVDLERRMEDLQSELSPSSEVPTRLGNGLQQLDYVTQALGDLNRFCSFLGEGKEPFVSLTDRSVVKLDGVRNVLADQGSSNAAIIEDSGRLMLF